MLSVGGPGREPRPRWTASLDGGPDHDDGNANSLRARYELVGTRATWGRGDPGRCAPVPAPDHPARRPGPSVRPVRVHRRRARRRGTAGGVQEHDRWGWMLLEGI